MDCLRPFPGPYQTGCVRRMPVLTRMHAAGSIHVHRYALAFDMPELTVPGTHQFTGHAARMSTPSSAEGQT